MLEHECERCGLIFKMKKHLIQHLNKRVECIGIESERTQEELLEDLTKKEGVDCEKCKRVYKNEESLRRHRCKVIENVKEELEKRIKELEGMLKDENTVNQIAKTIDNSTTIDNRRIKTIDNSTTNNTTNNITVVINDIDSLEGIDYILKDPKFVERILNWVTDKKGLLKYMDDRYYNPKRPENRGIRKVDNENIELRIRGEWRRCDNITALGAIIESMRIDWDSIIGIIKDDYNEEYNSNKKEMVAFKREVSDPLDMEWDITDDEEEKRYGKEMVYIEEKNMYKDEELVKKEKIWKERIMKSVK
jgi:uncharacterized C2H2 Zn-finger protein